MNIIHLTDGQRRCVKINHPLLDHVVKMSEQELQDALSSYQDGSEVARDQLIMGHLYCVKNIVGRFLAHWPESKRFEEDMVSEGLIAVTDVVNIFGLKDSSIEFQKKIWGKIQDRIENMLNDSRSAFSACKSENYELLKDTGEVEYNYTESIHDGADKGSFDSDPQFIDFMDELEQFSETDQEHFRHLITQCMDQEHDIPESELSEKDIEAIEAAARILGNL